jgi:spore maturation protein CgeB
MECLTGHVIGEEAYAESLCRELRQLAGVQSAQLYAPNVRPTSRLDVMIHLNDTIPGSFAYKHILYFQNFYNEGSDIVLAQLQKLGYNGYAFLSQRLLNIHQQAGYSGILLPLAADTAIFHPKVTNPHYEYDVAYVGNDIKGEERTMRYLYPAINYKFGLFGNWKLQPYSYSRTLAKLSQGHITHEELAILYSSAKIILNFTGQDSVIWDAMNLRFFEVLACRGFLISDKVPSASHELKDCVVFTDGYQDLNQKIEYYLARPQERKEIAEHGYQYVIQNATVQARAKQLFHLIEEIM